MRSLLSVVCLLLTLGRRTFVSAIILGFDCDNEFFANDALNKVADQAMNMFRLQDQRAMTLQKLSSWYDGPPFTKPYLLWPLFHKTKDHREPANTPYRIVLDKNFKVFSVMVKKGEIFKECKMRETFIDDINECDYECAGKLFKKQELEKAAKVACPQIRDGSMRRFPARYDGPLEGKELYTRGKQLYLFPYLESGIYKHDNDPGSVFLLLNSRCQIETVLRKTESSGYKKCVDHSRMSLIYS